MAYGFVIAAVIGAIVAELGISLFLLCKRPGKKICATKCMNLEVGPPGRATLTEKSGMQLSKSPILPYLTNNTQHIHQAITIKSPICIDIIMFSIRPAIFFS